MRVDLFTIIRNEEDLLPYFLRHYETFVDNIFIFNDRSTDKTAKIAKSNPKVKLLNFDYPGDCNEVARSECFENAYKEYSRGNADWAICVDGDEFVYHKNILEILKEQQRRGRNLLKTTGYTMFSDKFPVTNGQIYEECNKGIRTQQCDKAVILNPEIDLKFQQGRHKPPIGIKFFRCGIMLLHYRCLSKEFILKRWKCSKRSYSDEKYKRKIQINLDRYEKQRKYLTKII